MFSPILENYKKQILAYASGMRAPDRQMLELESYSIHASPEYIQKLGLDTIYLQRRKPSDWLVNIPFVEVPELDVISSDLSSAISHAPKSSMLGAIESTGGIRKLNEDMMYKEEVDALLADCAPPHSEVSRSVRCIERDYRAISLSV